MNFTGENNNGIANELEFVKIFDKNLVKELDKPFQELLYHLFDNLKESDYIECWKSKYNEKADIKIRINGNIKGISIKMGAQNSVHQESIDIFSTYLSNIGVRKDIVEKIKAYIYGTINGRQLDAEDYKKRKYNDIVEIKNALSDFYIKTNLILRFLFQGRLNQLYDADAIIHGTPDDFLWADKSEILKYLLSQTEDNSINVKTGPLYIQSRNRNLKCNVDTIDAENKIQVKWYSLRKDLLAITKNRKMTQKTLINDKKEQ